jgi:hypothetical protein
MLQTGRPNAAPVLASPPLCAAAAATPLFAGVCICLLPSGAYAPAQCAVLAGIVQRNGGRAFVRSRGAAAQQQHAWTHVIAAAGVSLEDALAALSWRAAPGGVAVCATAWLSDCAKQRVRLPCAVRHKCLRHVP